MPSAPSPSHHHSSGWKPSRNGRCLWQPGLTTLHDLMGVIMPLGLRTITVRVDLRNLHGLDNYEGMNLIESPVIAAISSCENPAVPWNPCGIPSTPSHKPKPPGSNYRNTSETTADMWHWINASKKCFTAKHGTSI